jgi:cytochrome P450
VGRAPESDVDPFDDAVLADPYPSYRRLRDVGPVVWMQRHGVWALPRYQEVRQAMREWETFSSASGVGMTDEFNDLPGGILGSDPPDHDHLRRVFRRHLSHRALRPVEEDLEARANALVDALVERGSFDAVRDLAHAYTVSVVADLVGLPDEGRPDLLANSDAGFNRFGPANSRYAAAAAGYRRMVDHAATVAVPGRLAPGGMGAALYEAADAGELHPSECSSMMLVYTWPSMDTTVSAIGHAVHRLAQHPDQWDLVRADPGLVPAAFDEVLRIDAPVQLFTRVTTRAVEIGGTWLPAGARVMVMMGSANRDERHFPDPDRFVVRRDPSDHLSFGHGVHLCVGAALARLEGHAVIRALTSRVARLSVVERRPHLNNVIHGLGSLQVRVDARA